MGIIAEEQHRVREAWDRLGGEWEQAREQWQDEVGEFFEREYWADLASEVPMLLRAMAELDEVLDQALYNTED